MLEAAFGTGHDIIIRICTKLVAKPRVILDINLDISGFHYTLLLTACLNPSAFCALY